MTANSWRPRSRLGQTLSALTIGLLLAAPPVLQVAAEGDGPDDVGEAAEVSPLGLEEPCTGEDDWVQLSSSEWLKGDVRRMRRRHLDFWSREVKSRKIKWRKVIVLCMASEARFVTRGYMAYTGRGTVRGDKVSVVTSQGEVRFAREDLTGILPGRDRELDRWGLQLGLGIDANEGNTSQTSFSLSGAILREDRYTRAEISYSGSVGTVDGEENINRHRIASKMDWYFTRQLYWQLLDLPVTYDKFQNVDARVAPSTGLGWQVFDRPGLEWSVEAGLGYQYTSFISVVPPQAPDAHDAAVRLSTSLSWDIISNLELKVDHSTTAIPTEPGLTTLYTRAGLKYELTWLLKLETVVVHNRTFDPVAGSNGEQPEPDDVQFIVGFRFETN